MASAGHDTTKDAISGGLRALTENPGELARLQTGPGLMGTAVEELIRWTTPVKEFMRTATADTTVRGVDSAAGESVCLAYVSGNRDEAVFTELSGRLQSIELAGPLELAATTFVGGLKHLPIRYSLR